MASDYNGVLLPDKEDPGNSSATDWFDRLLDEHKRLIDNYSINADMYHKISLSDVDRIAFMGDSYTAGFYNQKHKAWVSLAQEFTDYNCEGHGFSGYNALQMADVIRNNTKLAGSPLGWQDYKPCKALLMSYNNDMVLSGNDSSVYQSNMRELIDTCLEYGTEPIVCTEFRDPSNTGYVAGVQNMCDELGLKFWNILNYTSFLNHTNQYADFWNTNHPGTRTCYIILDQYVRHLEQLERPKQSIKMFRKRTSVSVGTLNDLLYDNKFERMELFKEIDTAHFGLNTPADFDDITGTPAASAVPSEYLKLQNGDSVSFADYLLVEIVVDILFL